MANIMNKEQFEQNIGKFEELMESVVNSSELMDIKRKANEALKNSCDAESLEDREKYDAELAEAIDEYAKRSKALTYQAARQSGDPMKFAIMVFFYPVIKEKRREDKEMKVIIREVEDANRPIDLGDMHKRMGGIGADTNWIYTSEKFNFYMTYRAAERVNATAVKTLLSNCDAFTLHKIAKERDLGKNPCSNTQLLKTLNLLISEMLGEDFKALSHDVRYLEDVYANDNKKSKTGITLANHKTLRNYLKKVCYRVLTGGIGYDVEQREIKKEK